MKISEMLVAVANWLEDPSNEAILLAEHNKKSLKIVASSCVEAAACLRKAAEKVDNISCAVCGNDPDTCSQNGCFGDMVSGSVKADICPVCHKDHSEDPDNTCDFEECGLCGFDHDYEYDQAHQWHLENPTEGYDDWRSQKMDGKDLEGIGDLANALDSSGDPELAKQASVLDALLLGVSAPKGAYKAAKAAEDYRLEELNKKYHNPSKELAEMNKVSDSEKAIDKSNMTKRYRVLEAPLSSRTCADHPGCQLARVGENQWMCEMDKRIYDYSNGFTLNNGDKVPGGDVSLQTQPTYVPTNSLYDTREGRLQSNK